MTPSGAYYRYKTEVTSLTGVVLYEHIWVFFFNLKMIPLQNFIVVRNLLEEANSIVAI